MISNLAFFDQGFVVSIVQYPHWPCNICYRDRPSEIGHSQNPLAKTLRFEPMQLQDCNGERNSDQSPHKELYTPQRWIDGYVELVN